MTWNGMATLGGGKAGVLLTVCSLIKVWVSSVSLLVSRSLVIPLMVLMTEGWVRGWVVGMQVCMGVARVWGINKTCL